MHNEQCDYVSGISAVFEKFLIPQVAEERALGGFCGSPMCMNALPRVAAGKLRRKLSQSTYCRCVKMLEKVSCIMVCSKDKKC